MATAVQGSATQSPTALAFSEIRSQIANYVQAATMGEELAIAGQAADSAVDYLNLSSWKWNAKADTITFVDGTQTYSLNSDVKKSRKFQLLDSNSKVTGRLKWYDPKTFWDIFTDQTVSGTPTAYTIVSLPNTGKLTLNVAPGAGFVSTYPTGQVQYMARIAHLTSGGSWDGPPEVAQFLVWYGRWEMASTHGTTEKVIQAERHWTRILREMKRDDNDDQRDF